MKPRRVLPSIDVNRHPQPTATTNVFASVKPVNRIYTCDSFAKGFEVATAVGGGSIYRFRQLKRTRGQAEVGPPGCINFSEFQNLN